MKFLPENRKKTIWALALLLVSAGGTIYINFFTGNKNTASKSYPPAVIPTEGGMTTPDTAPAGTPPGGASTQMPGSPAAPTPAIPAKTELLPYGPKFDTSIFESEKFKVLKGVPPVSVTLEELGKTDPFK